MPNLANSFTLRQFSQKLFNNFFSIDARSFPRRVMMDCLRLFRLNHSLIFQGKKCQKMSNLIILLLFVASPDGSAVWGVVVSTRWWLLVDHCVLRNWGRILVRAVKRLISRAGMVSICPLLWQRDVKLPTNQTTFCQFSQKLS